MRMNGEAIEESSNTDELRSSEQKSGLDSRDVDMKPASPGSHTPATTPTTPEALKKSSKRGKIRVRLNLFNNKRRKAASLESPTNTDVILFGQRLATMCKPLPEAALPRPLMKLLRTLYVNGPTTEGIFRRCPSKTACSSVRKQLESGIDCGPIDVHIASSLLAELLRKLPDCLLRCRMYDQWLESSSKTDQEDRISSLRQLVRGLPPCNLLLLRHLICVLHRIDRNSEQTKMTSRNLGLCLGPSLLWSKTETLEHQAKDVDRTAATVKALIDHAPDIFGPDCLELFRHYDSCSITALSTDHQADVGIESTDPNPPQCARGSNDLSTTSLSQANVLAPTSLEPPPVAPPRRKRSSVVAPPPFVCIAEESTSDQSATPIAAKEVLEDKRNLSRSLSSDSEVSGREWAVKNYGTETTDGETVEDSDETSATEEDLDGHRWSMLSEDLADEEDSSMVGPTVERRIDIVNIQERHKSGGTPTAIEHNLSRLSSSLTSPPSAVKSNRSTEAKQEKNASIGLMSFSSTEESIAGDRAATSKPLFFGSSFSSTAGSDAELSTFAESLDSGVALSESYELACGTRRRKQIDMDVVSNSSAATIPLEDYHNREVQTVAYNTHDRKYMMSKHQRMSQINDKWDLESSAKATANTGDHGTHATSDSALDVCDSGISPVTNHSGRASYHRASQVTDTSDQLYSPKSTQTPDTSGQSASVSRRHSFGCRDPGSVDNLCETQARQLRGMTHKGSDVFPGKLPKTLGSRANGVYDQNGRECKSLSGAKSEKEGGGRLHYPGKKMTSDERIIVSDIEFSESTGKTHNAPRRDGHRTAKGCENPDSPGASRLPLASQDGRQLDSDVGGFNTAQTTLMGVNEEDEEKNSNARRLPLEPPDYDEAVKQLKNHQQRVLVSSLANQEESILHTERQKEGERIEIKEKEKKKQPAENFSTRQRRLASVGIEDASALAQLAARSCGDLSKAVEQNATDGTNKFPRPEHGSELKHVHSLGSLASGDSLKKRFCIPRSQRWGIRDSSSSSSSKSNSDEEATLLRRLEDNLAKKRVRRKKYRRSRKARNSDTRLQTDRENRVNLVRSKSDSNTLLRELIVKHEDAEHARETFRKEISRRKADQKTILKDVFQDRQEGKENLNNGAIRVKNLEDGNRIGCELTLTTREGNRKSVALKDREWHKDLVREVESTQKSQSSRYPNSGTPVSGSEGKLQRKSKDSCSHSANNNTGTAIFTIPGASTSISKTRHWKLLDYSSSDSTKPSTDDATRISDSGERCLGKLNDEESVSCGGSGGDGSGSSTTKFIEFRANQLKKSDRDFQKDSNRSKETIAKKCAPKEDNSNIVNAPGNFLGAQKPHQRTNTVCSDTEHGSTRDCFKGTAAVTQPSREFTVQPVIKNKEDEDDASEKTPSDPCKSSTSQFERISVKDIVAMKNSSSGSASSKDDPPKPSLPSSSRRGEERTEAWRPETGRPVARRASQVTPQVKSEVKISLTPELSRKTPPRAEQKPASIPSKNSSETNQLPLPVRARSHSVKYLNVRQTEVEQKQNAETTFPRPSQTTAADASTSDPSQRQRLGGSSKSPWQKTLASLSGKSSHESSRSDDLSIDPGKGEKKIDCGEPAAGQSVFPSQGYDLGIDKSTKTEMPWSVANLRSKYRHGNQNPQ